MSNKSIVDSFFYFSLGTKAHSIFKDMVQISEWKNKNKVNNKWIRELALQELNSIEKFISMEPNNGEYNLYLETLANRLTNKHFIKQFQDKDDLKKYYEYLFNTVEPTEMELIHSGLKNSFFYFSLETYGTRLLRNSTNYFKEEKYSKMAQQLFQVRTYVLLETSFVQTILGSKKDNRFKEKERLWQSRLQLSPYKGYFGEEENIQRYFNHLMIGINPIKKEKKEYNLNTSLFKFEDEIKIENENLDIQPDDDCSF
jgi:hypothetical protein